MVLICRRGAEAPRGSVSAQWQDQPSRRLFPVAPQWETNKPHLSVPLEVRMEFPGVVMEGGFGGLRVLLMFGS